METECSLQLENTCYKAGSMHPCQLEDQMDCENIMLMTYECMGWYTGVHI